MATREAIYAVTEGAYGTVTANAVLNTNSWYFNLPDSDSFQGVMSPVFQEVPYGGGEDVPFDVMADHYETKVNWSGLVYPSVDNFLLNLSCQRINSAQTTPWVTTEPAADLPSASIYKLWTPRGSTAVRKRYPGCKVAELQLDCSRQDPKLKFKAQLVAQKETGNTIESGPPADPDATEFPAPTDAQLPTGPYLFSHSSTNLLVAGVAVTNYQSVSLKVSNKLDVLWFENKFPSVVALHGRTVELTFTRLLSTSPNYRNRFQAITTVACYLKFDNGTSSFKVDMGARCHVSAYAQQLGLGKEFLEVITVKGKWDTSTGNDAVLTFT